MTRPRKFPTAVLLAAALLYLASCGWRTAGGQPEAEPGAEPGPVAGDKPVTSGLQVGEPVGVFRVVKVGGVDDGVAVGQLLCYC